MNELEKRAKKHRKKLNGMSSFSKLNAGNVEQNIAMFNSASTPSGGPSLSPVGPMGESFENLVKGDWVVVNLESRLNNFVNLIPVKFENFVGEDRKEFVGWAHAERLHTYHYSQIKYIATSEQDAQKFVDEHEGIKVKDFIGTKPLRENSYFDDDDYVELYYANLPVTFQSGDPGYFDSHARSWVPDTLKDFSTRIEYVYKADKDSVFEFIGDKLVDEMSREEFRALEDPDAYITNLVENNFDEYVEKYYKELCDEYEEEAIEDARENYDIEADYEPQYYYGDDRYESLDSLREALGLNSEDSTNDELSKSKKLRRNDSFDSISDLIDLILSRDYFVNFSGSTPTTEYLDVFKTYSGPHVSIEYSEKPDGSITIVNIKGLYSDLFEGIEDDFELQSSEQEFSSKTTAHGNGKANGGYGRVPALFKAPAVKYPNSGVLLDYGCGEYSTSERIKEYVTDISPDLVYVGFDKFNRSAEENSEAINIVRQNGGADIVTCANVLNVIKEREIRVNEVIGNIYKLLKSGGTAYFDVYEAKGKVAAQTGKDKYQLFKGLDDYIEEIEEVFGPNSATRRGKVIVAVK